jgi:hypothetical protein
MTGAACLAAMLTLCGCAKKESAGEHDYASLINRSGKTGMRGPGSFAGGSRSYPGYPELPVNGGNSGNWAPSTGNHEPITKPAGSASRGLGIANDSGGLGIGAH